MKKTVLLISIFMIALSAGTAFATNQVDITTGDSYYYFHSTNSSEADDGYYASIVVDGVSYYLNETLYNELCRHSDAFATGFMEQFLNGTSVDDAKNLNATPSDLKNKTMAVDDFKKQIDEEFSFHYKTGKVGTNENSNIITKLNL